MLAPHTDDGEFGCGGAMARLVESGADGLGPGQLEALNELSERLERAQPGERGELEMIARETLEALALGD